MYNHGKSEYIWIHHSETLVNLCKQLSRRQWEGQLSGRDTSHEDKSCSCSCSCSVFLELGLGYSSRPMRRWSSGTSIIPNRKLVTTAELADPEWYKKKKGQSAILLCRPHYCWDDSNSCTVAQAEPVIRVSNGGMWEGLDLLWFHWPQQLCHHSSTVIFTP